MKNTGKLIFIIVFFSCSVLYGAENPAHSLRVPLMSQNIEEDRIVFCNYMAEFLSLMDEVQKEIQEWHPEREKNFVTDEDEGLNLFVKLGPVFAFYNWHSQHGADPEEYINAIKALLDVIDGSEPGYEQGHTERVAWLVLKLKEELKKNNQALRENEEPIVVAALLHDLGKVFFPEAIFKTTSPQLTEMQDRFRKGHHVWGARILESFPEFNRALALNVRHHHERYDIEGGYPDGLRKEDIPLGSRIIAVADVMDGMLSKRAYDKKSHSLKEVINYMKQQSGKWFDPSAVDALLSLYEKGELQIYETKGLSLTDARQAVIDYLISTHSKPVIDRSLAAPRKSI